jgi:CDP-diacylglycerol--glycerol-3-phosphate 3-phosphatidyltransferase
MILSDYLDGFLARKWEATSVTGRIIDPIADKICIVAVGISLAYYKGFPIFLLIALVLRDLVILSASLYSIRKLKKVPQSNIVGKITVGILSACMLAYLFDIELLKLPLIVAVVIFIPLSLFSYGLHLRKRQKLSLKELDTELNKKQREFV